MTRSLRYTTFAPGELEARLRELAPQSQIVPITNGHSGRTLLKEHCCEVRYPDTKTGNCRYERLGPRWHLFHFRYEQEGVPLPRQAYVYPLGNDPAHIEAKAQELAEAAYREAISEERRKYFQRASEPKDGSRKKNPRLYRMKAKRAKELAGKYALCRLSGAAFTLFGKVYETLDEANAAWRERSDTQVFVCCCNRLDRCWQLPRFNPLYATFDPRPRLANKPAMEVAEEASSTEETNDSPDSLAFSDWMREVILALEGLCGMHPDDLPDCPYADWHGDGLGPQEAAEQAMEMAS